MQALYRGISYDPEHIDARGPVKDLSASFRGHSFEWDELDTPSATAFVYAQFRGHKFVADELQMLTVDRNQSERLCRTLKSLKGTQVIH